MAPNHSPRGPSTAHHGKALLVLFLLYVFWYIAPTISNDSYAIASSGLPGIKIPRTHNPVEVAGRRDLRSTLGTTAETHGYTTNTSQIRKRQGSDSESDDGDVDHIWWIRKQSQWVRTEQLEATGWTVGNKAAGHATNDLTGNDGPYQALGIDFTRNVKIGVEQDKEYSNCAHENLEATDAYFDNIYNVQGKLIIATASVSPIYKLKMNEDPTALLMGTSRYKEFIPPISFWSDIVAIVWTAQAGIQASSLKYVMRYNIFTDATRRVMNKAAAKSPESGVYLNGIQTAIGQGFIAPWPGVEYPKGDERFQAILGTAHANGVVQLLADHEDLLPGKDIESVAMFTTDEGRNYNLLFTLTG